jgi:polysaccharide export outer membrane protein
VKGAESLSREQLEKAATVYEARIMPKDVLSISVTSETPGAAADFNLSFPYKTGVLNPVTSESFASKEEFTYIVDAEGYVNFPILGRVKVGGLTKNDAEALIFSQIYPAYLTEKPFIDIRFLDFSVTVLGEVVKPGIYKSENEQMSIFDALAAAGDMTIYGRRDNVLLMRTAENGELHPIRINLQDPNILLDKNLFYLQQHDKIYVETSRSKANSRSFGVTESAGLSIVSLLVSIASVLTYYSIYRSK